MNDINEQKKSMRSSFILLRSQISDKSKKDEAVFRRLISLDSICSADTVLSYISVGTETDTLKIIDYLLSNGIKVAAPRCKKNGIMDFFYISSLNETIAGKYGIPETVGNEMAAVTKNTVCLTPALSISSNGIRIGYGGGYYDRFFSKNPQLLSIGLSYEKLISSDLQAGSYDVPLNMFITEERTVMCNAK